MTGTPMRCTAGFRWPRHGVAGPRAGRLNGLEQDFLDTSARAEDAGQPRQAPPSLIAFAALVTVTAVIALFASSRCGREMRPTGNVTSRPPSARG